MQVKVIKIHSRSFASFHFFNISCKNNENTDTLRLHFQTTIAQKVLQHFIPKKYLYLEEVLVSYGEELGIPVVDNKTLMELAKACGIKQKKEAVECVKLLNEFGRVIIVENEVLVDYVVVDMVWIQNIINHLFQTKESWSSHGIFERKALESMWRKEVIHPKYTMF